MSFSIYSFVVADKVYCSNHLKVFENVKSRQWLCGSVGRFRDQRSAVRIRSLAKVYLYWTFVYCQLCIEKTKIKKKRPGKVSKVSAFFTASVISIFPSQLVLIWPVSASSAVYSNYERLLQCIAILFIW